MFTILVSKLLELIFFGLSGELTLAVYETSYTLTLLGYCTS